MFGTIHSSHSMVRDLPDPVTEALAASEVFLPELELSPENVGRMLAAVFDWEGSRLEERLPDELRERVRRTTRRLGLPDLMLRNISFEMLPFFLAQPPGGNFNQIVDVQLYRAANEHGLEIVPLETLEEQMDVFQNLDEATTLELIRDALDEAESGYPSYRKLVGLYASGDEKAAYSLLQELKQDTPEAFRDALFSDRNRTMIERARPHLEQGNAFIAVGLGHFLGETGIITLLRNEGYEVRRVERD